MIEVVVPWRDQMNGANYSVQLSRWCKDQGLVDGIDYHWAFVPNERKTIFHFEDSAEQYASFFALKWTENEI